MKKYFSIVSIAIFIGLVFYLFILPKIKSKHYALDAIVISISPPSKRSGTSEIQLKDVAGIRYLYYTFLNSVEDINIGDSLLKTANNKTLFVKSKKDSIIREAKDQNYLLGP